MRSMLFDLRDWVDARFPLTKLWNEHLAEYYAPKNFNFWYFFGSLAMLVLVLQLGYRHLANDVLPALGGGQHLALIEFIMRDVEWGWLIRYMHSTGASFFFVVVYLHMFRGVMYGSFKKPRELIWVLGMMLYGALMAEAFMGYSATLGTDVLLGCTGHYFFVWRATGYWRAAVVVDTWRLLGLRCDLKSILCNARGAVLPLVLLGLVGAHIMASARGRFQ